MKLKKLLNRNIPVSIVLMLSVTNAWATIINMSYVGSFVLGTHTGSLIANPDSAGGAGVYDDGFGARTTVTGTMTYDSVAGIGTATVDPFLFSGSLLKFHDFNMQAIGDGNGGPGTLIMSSLFVDNDTFINNPSYMISDAAGFLGAIDGGVAAGDVISGVGAASSAEAVVAASVFGPLITTSSPGAAIPIAMTTLDVNQDGDGEFGGNLCGTQGGTGALINGGFPLCDDGVSGVRTATPAAFVWGPSVAGNIDFADLTVTSVVPVPAAVWLFGSGLIGLIGAARRKKE